MNYKQILEYLGLQEHIDFELIESSFEMVPKVEEILVDGEVQQIVHTPEAPSEEVLLDASLQMQLDNCDIALLVEQYLLDKVELRDPENDEINIADSKIHRWGFAKIPCPSKEELISLKDAANSRVNQEQINKEAEEYLAKTDYFVIRMMDSGLPMPEGMHLLRQQARDRIVRS